MVWTHDGARHSYWQRPAMTRPTTGMNRSHDFSTSVSSAPTAESASSAVTLATPFVEFVALMLVSAVLARELRFVLVKQDSRNFI
jgi:hypothetical protein